MKVLVLVVEVLVQVMVEARLLMKLQTTMVVVAVN
jgi:hypothetical protein